MRLKQFLSDNTLKTTSVISILLTICHLRQFVYSGYEIQPMIRLVLCALYTPSVILFGRKAFLGFFMVFAYLLTWFNTFNNYTSFMIIMLLTYFLPKYEKQLLWMYAIDVLCSFTFRDMNISHLLIHGLNCVMIYHGFHMLKDFVEVKPLMLTKSEAKILNEMLNGKSQKEVSCYNTNTVYKKLQEARTRNNCHTTSELLFRYKHSNEFHQ